MENTIPFVDTLGDATPGAGSQPEVQDYASQDGWDVVLFDTAPTGHTMRLLELPVDWSKQLDIKVFASVDSTAADDVAKQRFGAVIEMMRDPQQSTFAFVMYPEATPIVEAYRASTELRTIGIEPGLVVANQVIPPEAATTSFSEVQVTYYDLLDPACPTVPPNTQLPLVLMNGSIFSSGGKLSAPALRRHVEQLSIRQDSHTLESL